MTEEQLREVIDYYAQGVEVGRLTTGRGRLEFARTQDIVRRFLPNPPALVVDVGGGTGAYTRWLAGIGYDVHLIDPVPLHVEHARAIDQGPDGHITATVGDARHLPIGDARADLVLLFGPLYHLPELADRVAAGKEAQRVLRPGGHVLAAAVSKWAGLFDTLFRPDVNKPGFVGTAYFHHPDELRGEVEASGLEFNTVLGVEGPGFLLPDFDRQWDTPALRERILEVARASEDDPALRGLHSHFIAVAHKAMP